MEGMNFRLSNLIPEIVNNVPSPSSSPPPQLDREDVLPCEIFVPEPEKEKSVEKEKSPLVFLFIMQIDFF